MRIGNLHDSKMLDKVRLMAGNFISMNSQQKNFDDKMDDSCSEHHFIVFSLYQKFLSLTKHLFGLLLTFNKFMKGCSHPWNSIDQTIWIIKNKLYKHHPKIIAKISISNMLWWFILGYSSD